MARLDFPITVDLVAEPTAMFRACHGADDAAVLAAVRSNYEAGRSPHPADLRATVLHMAVSMFESETTVARLAARRPDRIGTHVLRIELVPDRGICLGDTGGPEHW